MKHWKPNQLLRGALCAVIALCAPFAQAAEEEDFGIESASPVVIADLVNPQPGMVFNAYKLDGWMDEKALPDSNDRLPSLPATKTGLDKGERFALTEGTEGRQMRWEGFLKCKRAGVYTFTFNKPSHSDWGGDYRSGYSVRINGKSVLPAANREASCDAPLQVGWNKVEIVCQFHHADPLTVSYKPKGSVSEPRPLAPKDLFHDEKPEEEW